MHTIWIHFQSPCNAVQLPIVWTADPWGWAQVGWIPSGGAVGALSTCQLFHDRAGVNISHLLLFQQLIPAQTYAAPQTRPAPSTHTLRSKKSLGTARQDSTSLLASHTAACRHIVRPSLSMSLSPLRTTCAHPTANLSSHQEWPLEF